MNGPVRFGCIGRGCIAQHVHLPNFAPWPSPEKAGTLAPGNAGTGVLTVGGSLALDGHSLLAITVSGSPAAPTVTEVDFSVSLTIGGNLSITEPAGFTLAAGEKFFLLDGGSGATANGSFANAPGGIDMDAAGNTFLINYGDSSGDGSPGNDVSATVLLNAVPEPAAVVWVLAGLGGLVVLQRRRLRAA